MKNTQLPNNATMLGGGARSEAQLRRPCRSAAPAHYATLLASNSQASRFSNIFSDLLLFLLYFCVHYLSIMSRCVSTTTMPTICSKASRPTMRLGFTRRCSRSTATTTSSMVDSWAALRTISRCPTTSPAPVAPSMTAAATTTTTVTCKWRRSSNERLSSSRQFPPTTTVCRGYWWWCSGGGGCFRKLFKFIMMTIPKLTIKMFFIIKKESNNNNDNED